MTDPRPVTGDRLARRRGLFDAVVIGLGSTIGAGIFAALAPASAAAGCLVLAFALPPRSVIIGAAVPAAGGAAYGIRRVSVWR